MFYLIILTSTHLTVIFLPTSYSVPSVSKPDIGPEIFYVISGELPYLGCYRVVENMLFSRITFLGCYRVVEK